MVPLAPHHLPVLGHVPALLRAPMPLLRDARERGDIVRLRLGLDTFYLLNSPEFVRQVQVTQADSVDRGRIFAKSAEIVGRGLATSDGVLHRSQRRTMQPMFHRDRIIGYTDIMREQTEEMLATWEADTPIAFEKQMTALALGVLTKSVFRSVVGEQTVAEVVRSLPAVVDGVLLRSLLPDLWSTLPVPVNRRFATARRRLRGAVHRTITDYRVAGVDHGDLLSALLAARDPRTGEPMSDEQLCDEVLTILMAGTETTGSALAWLFHELAQAPELRSRLEAELDAVLAGRPVRSTDLPDLEFVQRLIAEVTRLYAPVWFLMRRLTAPIDFGGVVVPAGAQVVYSPTALHRDPRFYPDPERFDPDRWAESSDRRPPAELSRAAYIPFGAGVHKCIGDGFARAEMAVVIATIGTRWRLSADPDRPVRQRVQATFRPDSLWLVPRPRVPAGTVR